MSQEQPFINGELLRLRRESRGWVLNDMATRACMSVKQIRQLEEGGTSAFYSVTVKVTAAKKVGALLGVTPEEVLGQHVDALAVEKLAESEVSTDKTLDAIAEEVHSEPLLAVAKTEQVESVADVEPESSVSLSGASSSKKVLWIIAAALGSALVFGVNFQPQEDQAAEPAPPIQVLPAELAVPASGASAADAAASTPDVVAPSAVALPTASSASTPAKAH